MEQVYGVNSDGQLKFAPAETIKRLTRCLSLYQGDKSAEEFAETIISECKVMVLLAGKQFAGSAFVKHFLKKDGKTLQNYKSMTDDKRDEYDDKGMELLKACIFMRGCKCRQGKMFDILTDKYAHGDLTVFPETLNDALNLYRVSYQPKPNYNNSKSKSGANGTLGAHFLTEGHSTTQNKAALFYAEHVKPSDIRGWNSDSDSDSLSDDQCGQGYC